MYTLEAILAKMPDAIAQFFRDILAAFEISGEKIKTDIQDWIKKNVNGN